MSKIRVQRAVGHPVEAVWSAMADFGGIYKFHPVVARSPVTNGRSTGLGAERTCHFHDGNTIDERVVGWVEGQRMEIEIVRGSMPLARARAVLEVAPRTEGGSLVSMEMDYRPKYGLLGQVMDVVMMRNQFRKILGQVLEGLDQHLQTGEIVGPAASAA